jgi:hypothetical protein
MLSTLLHMQNINQGIAVHVAMLRGWGQCCFVLLCSRQSRTPECLQSPGRSDGNSCGIAAESHSGTIIRMECSPFMPGVFLSLGDWTFTIGRLQTPEKPSFVSLCASAMYTAGAWSPSRPGKTNNLSSNPKILTVETVRPDPS